MTGSVEIRRATPADLGHVDAALRALAEQLGDPYRVGAEDIGAAAFGATPSILAVIALEPEGECVGVLLASPIFSTSQGGAGLFVNDLWVDRVARGRGIARRLMATACREAGATWGETRFLRLMAHDHNAVARDVYDRLGFRPMEGMGLLTLQGAAFDQLEKTR
jgi:GNAT superfamily N-acetyltransferase